jgi:hypothetical protein
LPANFERFDEPVGQREHAFDLRGVEVLDRNDVDFAKP